MVLLRAKLRISLSRRAQVVRSLTSILGPTRAIPGCVSCQLMVDSEDPNLLLLEEEWSDEDSLSVHIKADSFKVVLSSLDYASERPDLSIGTLSQLAGMEFIAACRQAPPHA